MKTFGESAAKFYATLPLPKNLPEGISILDPYKGEEVKRVAETFFQKFFKDNAARVFVIGINPGRFGSGITGIPFTDTLSLREHCGIENTLENRQELSAQFVYKFIKMWGGVEKFYRDFYMTSVSPIGFLRGKVNCNYYDDPLLAKNCEPYIVEMLEKQLRFGAKRKAILFGTGTNYKAFSKLNSEHDFFEQIIPLEHPRFIAQYRRKRIDEYLEKYHAAFARALSK